MKAIHKRSAPRNKAGTEVKENDTRPLPSHEAIAEAAYYRAEKRGFAPGGELQDWLDARYELGQSSVQS